MSNEFEIVTLPSGVRTLRSVTHGETFHPVVGPMEEARNMHVAQHNLEKRNGPLVIWDVGFGAAANAIAALEKLMNLDVDATIHSFDISTAALEFALQNSGSLEYLSSFEPLVKGWRGSL